jgi:Transglutaminase-like superfamily
MRTAHKISLTELFLLTRAVTVVFAVRIALWLIPFRNLRDMINKLTRTRAQQSSRFSVDQLGWAVSVAGRYVPRATCLTQALALHMLLRREGLQSSIRLGVAKTEGSVKAHAWVESQGKVVIGNHDLEQYSQIMIWR